MNTHSTLSPLPLSSRTSLVATAALLGGFLLSACGSEDDTAWTPSEVGGGGSSGSAGAAASAGAGGSATVGGAGGGTAATGCAAACTGSTPSCNATTHACECTATSCGDGKVCQKGACVVDTACTVAKVAAAAGVARAQIESKAALPETVSVCDKQLGMGSFLALSTDAVLAIQSGATGALDPKEYEAAANPKDNTEKGDIPKAEYLDIVTRVKQFMDANGRAPNYSKDSSIGAYMGFPNLVYMYSEVLDEYHANGKLPDSVPLALFYRTTTNPLSPFAGYAQINLTTTWGSCGSHSGGVSVAYLRGLTTNDEAEQVESAIYWDYGGRVYGGPGRSDLAASINAYMSAKKVPYKAFLFSDGDAVQGYIDSGTPVIANTNQWGGHYVAIYGLVDEGGTVYVHFSDGAFNDGLSSSYSTGYLKKWKWSSLRSHVTSGYIGFKAN